MTRKPKVNDLFSATLYIMQAKKREKYGTKSYAANIKYIQIKFYQIEI
jgi:hypothetical protein